MENSEKVILVGDPTQMARFEVMLDNDPQKKHVIVPVYIHTSEGLKRGIEVKEGEI